MEFYRQLFPLDLSVKKGEVSTPFPILIDADRKLSKGLGLFMTEWGQNTVDRPEYDYLFTVLDVLNGTR